ncbi:MAG: TIGR00730 family Rossman fold protein [Spirochaetia bacterium]
MKKVSVFCGSSIGTEPEFRKSAEELGKYLAVKKIEIIYGGAKVGLMGAVADGALRNGGSVTGILPRFLNQKEIAHEGLTSLIMVETMHERKLRMNELSEGVIALPGGYGTLEELFEMITWGQLGLHRKPVGILNINRFYDPLSVLLENMVINGFLKESNRRMLMTANNAADLIKAMEQYSPPNETKWINFRESI